MKKTVVIGLDGATWKLLKPLVEQGDMPALQSLLAKGVHGNLESTIPAMTAPSWATFATGKHPGNHGIFDFMLPTDSLSHMKFSTSEDIRDKTVYEILKDNGYTPILINLPATYPPKLKNDITITSLLTQGDEWVFPASLKDEFPELKKYRLTPNESLRLKERSEEYIEDLLVHLDEQMAVIKRLFTEKPWDFFFNLFSQSDWVSHLSYTELLEDNAESPRRVFKKIDACIQWIIDNLPEDTNLIMVSDHGFKSYKKIFYFNRWLEKEEYLSTNTQGDEFRSAATRRAKETDKIRGTKKRINIGSGTFKALSKIPPAEKAAKWIYHHIVKPYLPVHIKVNVGIDFSKTKICFPKGSYITNAYINKDWVYTDGIVSKEEYIPLRDEVVEKMRTITDDEGNKVIKRVMTRDEVYGENAPDQAPDIFFELGDYWLVGQFQSTNLFAEEVHNKHDQDGIFLGYGPDFATKSTIDGLMMQDITPTILHLLGLPIPSDCDGTVHRNMFASDSTPAKQEPKIGAPSKLSGTPSAKKEKDAIKNALGNIQL